MPELVYILTNPTIPDLVKIGKTKNLEERLQQLSRHAGVPVPFECFFCCKVKNMKDIENRLHSGFGDHRINPKREFFRINPERVKDILEGWSLGEVTPEGDVVESQEEQDALNKERLRLPVFTFSMVGIPTGSKLTFLKKLEDEKFSAIVTSDRKIEYEGVEWSLSNLAVKIMEEKFGKKLKACRGPDYWVFENETLTERRFRLETEDKTV